MTRFTQRGAGMLALFALLAIPSFALADEPSAEAADGPVVFPADEPHRFGLELSATWFIIPGGIAGASTYRLWQKGPARGELVIGMQWDRPQDREEEGRFSNVALNLGYRQFFIRGLHLELGVLPGRGRVEDNPHTGRDYRSFDLELSAFLGYRLDIVRNERVTFYANLQGGIRYVAYKSNPWPQDAAGTTDETPFPVGNLAFGLRFR